jgi:hypothetical protein
MWYEWRTWGWMVVLLGGVSTVAPVVAAMLGPGAYDAVVTHGGWFIPTACAIGLAAVRSMREIDFSRESGRDFLMWRPLQTRTLALGSMAGGTSIFLVTALFAAVGARLAFGAVEPLEAVQNAALFTLLAWGAIHGFGLYLMIGCLGSLLVWSVMIALGLIDLFLPGVWAFGEGGMDGCAARDTRRGTRSHAGGVAGTRSHCGRRVDLAAESRGGHRIGALHAGRITFCRVDRGNAVHPDRLAALLVASFAPRRTRLTAGEGAMSAMTRLTIHAPAPARHPSPRRDGAGTEEARPPGVA